MESLLSKRFFAAIGGGVELPVWGGYDFVLLVSTAFIVARRAATDEGRGG